MTKANKERILAFLDKEYSDAKGELEYTKDYELLIAVVLSAQSTLSLIHIQMCIRDSSLTVAATREVIREMRDRKANVIVCSLAPFNHDGDSFIISNPIKGYHSPITFAVFAQYLAYYCAVNLGRDVDKPRNLTKAVKDRSV